MTADPTAVVIDAANGDFFLLLLGIVFLFIMSGFGYFVYQMPKQWEKSTEKMAGQWEKSVEKMSKQWDESTNRIIDKIMFAVTESQDIKKIQCELSEKYTNHDTQAKLIFKNTEDIKDTAKEIKDEIKESGRRMGMF